MLSSDELTPAQKTVLIALETFADFRNGDNAYPGVGTLAAMCRVDEKTVRRALDAAWNRLGLIDRTARANPKAHKSAVWRLVSTGQQSPVEDVSTGQQSPVDTPIEPDFYRASSAFLPDNFGVSTGLQSPPTLGDLSIEGGRAQSGTEPNSHAEPRKPQPSEQSANGKQLTRCARHAHIADDADVPNCWDCKRAREDHEAADARERAAIREAIDNCVDCDQFGRLDDLTDCPRHTNFRQHAVTS